MAAVWAARGMVEASVCDHEIVSFGLIADTSDRSGGGQTWK